MYNDISQEVLDLIAAAGYAVYQPESPQWRSYAYFTDGTHIGYIQNDRLLGYTLTTVNIPCKECGTGFSMDSAGDFSREALARAFVVAPYWASATDRAAVRKYKDMESFLAARGNRGLIKVRESK